MTMNVIGPTIPKYHASITDMSMRAGLTVCQKRRSPADAKLFSEMEMNLFISSGEYVPSSYARTVAPTMYDDI
jgi:hypothetical protein